MVTMEMTKPSPGPPAQATRAPRVRFAPSPTGYLHVGGARTALFNWLFARHYRGTLVLRIEDTDLERSTDEMIEGILEGMRWLGLDWDEGPFYQTQRTQLYRANAAKLVESGHAYSCFCSKEELERRRQTAVAEGRPPRYEKTCRKMRPEEAARRRVLGESGVVRFAVPESGSTGFEDAVFGRVEFANTDLEDFVLLRSDGGPTYHLSVVSDDVDMSISHIIRGADHISNTPKQVLLYQALGAPMPVFAHVPLILGADKSRLSKRHGATSVMAYREQGIVPQALRNFLALMGWTPPEGSPEVMADAELISRFGLEGISKSNAVFDRAKLEWFNTEYIRSYPAEKLLPFIQQEWQKAGIKPQPGRELLAIIDLLKPRARSLKDFATSFQAFFTDHFVVDAAAADKFLKEENVRQMIVELGERYATSPADFSEKEAERILRELAEQRNVKAGVLINAARVALTGQAVAPSLFAVMMALGKQRTVKRLKAAQDMVRERVEEAAPSPT
jgi:glutamyl-tRNA synthetase